MIKEIEEKIYNYLTNTDFEDLPKNTGELAQSIVDMVVEKISEQGVQFEDDSIWCDMDKLINSLKQD